MIFSEPSGSIPCLASLAITWVNLPTVGGQPTQMSIHLVLIGDSPVREKR